VVESAEVTITGIELTPIAKATGDEATPKVAETPFTVKVAPGCPVAVTRMELTALSTETA
jgi:hypothetical protein